MILVWWLYIFPIITTYIMLLIDNWLDLCLFDEDEKKRLFGLSFVPGANVIVSFVVALFVCVSALATLITNLADWISDHAPDWLKLW